MTADIRLDVPCQILTLSEDRDLVQALPERRVPNVPDCVGPFWRDYPPMARTYFAFISSSTYLGRRVSKSMILAQVGVMRMSTICL